MNKKVKWMFVIAAVMVVLWLAAGVAWADGGHGHNHHGGSGDVDVSNVTNMGGSDNLAVGYGPDNDINECMAHWSVLIVTMPKRNKFCERQEFVSWAQATELHTPNSIKIMCSDPLGSEVFGSRDECIDVFTPKQPVPTSGPCDPCDLEERQADYNYMQQEQMAKQAAEFETLEQRLARIERNNRIAAQKAQERREYAQYTIERLEDESER